MQLRCSHLGSHAGTTRHAACAIEVAYGSLLVSTLSRNVWVAMASGALAAVPLDQALTSQRGMVMLQKMANISESKLGVRTGGVCEGEQEHNECEDKVVSCLHKIHGVLEVLDAPSYGLETNPATKMALMVLRGCTRTYQGMIAWRPCGLPPVLVPALCRVDVRLLPTDIHTAIQPLGGETHMSEGLHHGNMQQGLRVEDLLAVSEHADSDPPV
ncbi:hypothetical protein EDB86DRAFT_2824370 [Lactarius hatsudake]|nr:hypothetical protein EDB86DRAFT_2824370 [Lactarius hatsudake]